MVFVTPGCISLLGVRLGDVRWTTTGTAESTKPRILVGDKIQERERVMTLVGKVDTWQHFENGQLARAERDTNGDGIVDQWWEYPKRAETECPLIHSDMDGDGRPDPERRLTCVHKTTTRSSRTKVSTSSMHRSVRRSKMVPPEPKATTGGAKQNAQTAPKRAPKGGK